MGGRSLGLWMCVLVEEIASLGGVVGRRLGLWMCVLVVEIES